MKEITQVHIARVPFSIERAAQKELQQYLDAIANVTASPHREDMLNEIESRIVEILATKKIAQGGTITQQDVESIKQQLGEPTDFADEDADQVAKSDPAEDEKNEVKSFFSRKFYRDEKHGIIAGVCYGLAKSIGIDAIWLRLLFLALAFANGTGIIAYFVLAILMPNAKTDAERLEMQGRPVNFKQLQLLKKEQLREQTSVINAWTRRSVSVMFKLLRLVLSVAIAVIAVGLVMIMILAAVLLGALMFGADRDLYGVHIISTWYAWLGVVSVAAIIISMCLLLLGGLGMLRAWKLPKKLIPASGVILGIAVLTIASVAYPVGRDIKEAIDAEYKKKVTHIGTEIDNVVVDVNGNVTVAVSDQPRVEIVQPFAKVTKYNPTVTTNGTTVRVTNKRNTQCKHLCSSDFPTIQIFTSRPANITAGGRVIMLDVRDGKRLDVTRMDNITEENVVSEMSVHISGDMDELMLGQMPQYADYRDASIKKVVMTRNPNSSMATFGEVGELVIDNSPGDVVCYGTIEQNIPYEFRGVAIQDTTKVVIHGKDVTERLKRADLRMAIVQYGMPKDHDTCLGIARILGQ